MTHLALHILRIILPVYLTGWCLTLNPKGSVADLRGQAILQVQQARLTHVLDLCASLTDDGSLEPHASTRVPTEDGERTGTSATRAAKLLFGLYVASGAVL